MNVTSLHLANLPDVIKYLSFDYFEEATINSWSDDTIWNEFELRFKLPARAFRRLPVHTELLIPSTLATANISGVSYLEPTGAFRGLYTKICHANNTHTITTLDIKEEDALWDSLVGRLHDMYHVKVNLICSTFRGYSIDRIEIKMKECVDL